MIVICLQRLKPAFNFGIYDCPYSTHECHCSLMANIMTLVGYEAFLLICRNIGLSNVIISGIARPKLTKFFIWCERVIRSVNMPIRNATVQSISECQRNEPRWGMPILEIRPQNRLPQQCPEWSENKGEINHPHPIPKIWWDWFDTFWNNWSQLGPFKITTTTTTTLHPFNGLFSMTTWISWHQKGKPFWILMKQEMMGGSGISWTKCKSSAPRSRQITMPVPHHSPLKINF